MSEEKKTEKPKNDEGHKNGKPKQVDVNVNVTAETPKVKVDPEGNLQKLQDELEKVTAEATKAKKALEEEQEKTKTLTEEKDVLVESEGDLKAKLELIAEKEYKAKCEILVSKAKELFKDPKTGEVDEERIKEMQKKFEDPEKGPENLKMEEYMIGHLETMLKKGAEEATTAEAKKAVETAEKLKATQKAGSEAGSEATGQAKLTGAEATGEGQGGKTPETWNSYVAMIQDLRRRARDPSNPEKQAEARAHLDELWKKWAKMVRTDYMETGLKGKEGYSPETQKKTGKSIRKIHKEGV